MIGISDIRDSSGNLSIPINLTSTAIFSESFYTPLGKYFGLAYKASTAYPSLTLQLEQSWYRLSAGEEGAAHTNWNIPVNQADIVTTLNTSATQINSFSPTPFPFGRIKITGAAGTPTNTTLTLKLSMFEENK